MCFGEDAPEFLYWREGRVRVRSPAMVGIMALSRIHYGRYVCTYLLTHVCLIHRGWPSRPNSMVCFNDACDGLFIVDGK